MLYLVDGKTRTEMGNVQQTMLALELALPIEVVMEGVIIPSLFCQRIPHTVAALVQVVIGEVRVP